MGAGVETGAGLYRGYSPALDNRRRKLSVMLQFHGGGWVSGSNDSVANDLFCRRIAKLCDVIVVAVGYRLAVGEFNKDNHRHIVDSFGASVVEPWLASHGDPTRFSLFHFFYVNSHES
ncbi:hypothetical protein RYX36_015945 [Vicia faba]